LDWRSKRFAHRLQRGRLEGIEMRDDRLHIAPVKLTTPPEAGALTMGGSRPVDGLFNAQRATHRSSAIWQLLIDNPLRATF
jgi:hypothetical protein